jgi:Asp-tRNA(Asn)/Glu-tRNA(Gln) amidotransferase A subunit family amidase
VPVSLKDGFRVRGLDATIGYAALAFRPSAADGALPALLLRAGAVLYCKTNVPQTLMAIDPHNNLFGRTLNPANRLLTAGGSSGGEGALVAMRGSVLGVGTDVGGSIRIPAACNALYGVKPGVGRVPYAAQETGLPPGAHRLSVRPSAGPLAASLRDCELFLRAVAEAAPWDVDADVVHGDWASQGACRGPASAVVGVVRSDGLMTPLPPVQRALDDTVRALRAAGVRVVELDAANLLRGCQSLANSLMATDGYNASFDLLDATGEPPSPWLAGRIRRKPPATLAQARELQGRREQLRQQFLSVWQLEGGDAVDAFICPVAPHPVAPVDAWNGVSYTSAFNLLDLPAGVLPVRPVTAADLVGEVPDTKPIGSWDARNRELWTKVDRKVYLGSMLSVQVVAPALQERRLLGAMAIVDYALRRFDFGSASRL